MRASPIGSILNIVAVVSVIVMNWLANTLPFNNKSTGEISDQYPVLIQPAGYAFSIWSLIYLGLIAFAVYQALPSQQDNKRIERITPYFLISCVANIAWLLTWHYEILWLNIIIMLCLLGSLIAIYLQLRGDQEPISVRERWFLWLPFSLYLGWVTVATIVNMAVVLYAAGWQDLGIVGVALTAILILTAAGIAIRMLFYSHDPAYALVVVWALIAIAVRQSANSLIVGTVIVALVAIVASMLYLFATLRNGKRLLLNYSQH
jgi:hypothetical protein